MKRILSAIALAVAAFSASATPVPGTLTLSGFEHSPTPSGVVQDSVSLIGAGVGALNATFTDTAPFGLVDVPFLLYCIELHAPSPNFAQSVAYTMNSNPALGTFGNPFTATEQARLDKLFVKQFATTGVNTNADAVASAAMQLAVWEIITETGSTLSLNGGSFKVAGGLTAEKAAANALLLNLDSYSTTGYTVNFTSFNNGGNKVGLQDFLAVSVAPGGSCTLGNCDVPSVPEPTSLSLAMAGLAMFGIGALRRRRA